MADLCPNPRGHRSTCRLLPGSPGQSGGDGGERRIRTLLFDQLWATDLAVAIVNPRLVRQFAEAMGALEKTDRSMLP
jgi:hypothetical protein